MATPIGLILRQHPVDCLYRQIRDRPTCCPWVHRSPRSTYWSHWAATDRSISRSVRLKSTLALNSISLLYKVWMLLGFRSMITSILHISILILRAIMSAMLACSHLKHVLIFPFELVLLRWLVKCSSMFLMIIPGWCNQKGRLNVFLLAYCRHTCWCCTLINIIMRTFLKVIPLQLVYVRLEQAMTASLLLVLGGCWCLGGLVLVCILTASLSSGRVRVVELVSDGWRSFETHSFCLLLLVLGVNIAGLVGRRMMPEHTRACRSLLMPTCSKSSWWRYCTLINYHRCVGRRWATLPRCLPRGACKCVTLVCGIWPCSLDSRLNVSWELFIADFDIMRM